MSDQENTDTLPSEEIEDDVALRPSANADNATDVARYISAEVRAKGARLELISPPGKS